MEELEALVDRDSREVKYIHYFIDDVGNFQRKGGKWIPLVEETEGQFEDIPIIMLDPKKSKPLLDKWDAGGLTEADLKDYILEEDG